MGTAQVDSKYKKEALSLKKKKSRSLSLIFKASKGGPIC